MDLSLIDKDRRRGATHGTPEKNVHNGFTRTHVMTCTHTYIYISQVLIHRFIHSFIRSTKQAINKSITQLCIQILVSGHSRSRSRITCPTSGRTKSLMPMPSQRAWLLGIQTMMSLRTGRAPVKTKNLEILLIFVGNI